MRHLTTSVVSAVALSFLCPLNGLAQTATARQGQNEGRPPNALFGRGATRPPTAQSGSVLRQATADPVGDGIAYGALIGAGVGAALVAVLYAKCDGTCDAPEPAPMYLSAAAVGAGAGALAGWIIDSARRNTGRRVRVSAVVTPRRQAVRVAFTF